MGVAWALVTSLVTCLPFSSKRAWGTQVSDHRHVPDFIFCIARTKLRPLSLQGKHCSWAALQHCPATARIEGRGNFFPWATRHGLLPYTAQLLPKKKGERTSSREQPDTGYHHALHFSPTNICLLPQSAYLPCFLIFHGMFLLSLWPVHYILLSCCCVLNAAVCSGISRW